MTTHHAKRTPARHRERSRPETYRVTRLYRDRDATRVIARGLTLDAARRHCQHPETSSSTATMPDAIEHTRHHGPWFDSYEREHESHRATREVIAAVRESTIEEQAHWRDLGRTYRDLDELSIALQHSLAARVALPLDDEELALVDWREIAEACIACIEDASA